MGLLQSATHREALLAAGLLFGAAGSTALSLTIVTYENGQPAAWFASAFLACGLILLGQRYRKAFLAAGACLVFLVCAFTHWGWFGGLVLTAMSVIEAALAAFLTLRLSRTPRLANAKQALKLVGLAIIPATVVTMLIGGAAAKAFAHVGFWQTFGQGFPSHMLGMASLLPCALLIATPSRIKSPRRSVVETVILGISLAIFAYAPFSPISNATFLLIFPAATVYAFRLGAKKTAAAILILTMESLVMGYLAPAESWSAWGLSVEVIILIGQIYTLAVVWNGLFTALAINHQSRIKQHLERRTEIARRARSRALKASKAKTDFLATMSHEIRTPMNGIIGFTQVLLRRPDLDPEVRKQLSLIDCSSAALLTVVNDILDFSKVEAGEVVLSPTPVRLSALAQETMTIIGQEAQRKGLSLQLSMDGDTACTHLIDGQRLRQVLLNLLNNAVKFTEKGEVRLTVALEAASARFEISDTGVGVSEEGMGRLFRRFSQVDGSVTRTHGGTGLGLAICKGLIELMGGRIGADSVVGEGSTFWFEIPLGEASPIVEETPAAAQPEAVAAHILLVDDHPVNRDLGRTMLGMIGCTCDLAENGEEAVKAMADGSYDLVLMDVHMPVMDGLAATRAIRAMAGRAARTPIIALTADILPEQIERCRAAGMVEHLGKPLSIETLIAALERWIGRETEQAGMAA